MLNHTKFLTRFLLLILISLIFTIPVFAQNDDASYIIEGADIITQNGSAMTLKAKYNTVNVTSNTKWAIIKGGEFATIDSNGIITPLNNGAVTILAVYIPDGQTDSLSATKTVTITNQQVSIPSVFLRTNVESSGYIMAKSGNDGNESCWYYGTTDEYPQGTTFTFTAQERDYDFLYWKNVNSRKILTTDTSYTLKLGFDTSIAAVFRTSSAANTLAVFENNGIILQSNYISADSESYITVPQNPTVPGYTFDAWYLNGEKQSIVAKDKISASLFDTDRIYVAGYVPTAKNYSITVVGGSGSGEYKYNATVTAVVDEAAIPKGKKFAYWANEKNVISYNKVYSFKAGTDTVISAVYADNEPEELSPVITISTADVSAIEKKITFLAERSLPLDYELIETGILMNQNNSFNLYTNGVTKAVSSSYEPSGQFCARKKNVSNQTTWYARAYMIYKKNGVSYTIYSNITSAKL